MNLPALKYQKIGDVKLAYRQWGTTGKAIVLLHGFPDASSFWHKNAQYLAHQGWRVYAPEILGLGYSTAPLHLIDQIDHSLDGQAQLIQGFIDCVLPNENYVLLGQDLGGGIAQVMAEKKANAIDCLVLSNSVAFDTWPPRVLLPLRLMTKYLSTNIFKLLVPALKWRFRQGIKSGLVDPSLATDQLINEIYHTLTGDDQRLRHFIHFINALDNRITQRATPALSQFTKPLLLIWAEHDQYHTLATAKRIEALAANAKTIPIDAKHFHPLESNDLVSLFNQEYQNISSKQTAITTPHNTVEQTVEQKLN
jgi:pimeloyl-ACP methyl ester carboxylesterase